MTVFKTDLDIKLNKKQIKEYINTRKVIIESLGMKYIKHILKPSSNRGYHFYWHCEGEYLDSKEINFVQFLLGDDWGRCLINARRIKRGIENWNKIFDHVIWRREHKCNCSIHQKIIKRMQQGQRAFEGI